MNSNRQLVFLMRDSFNGFITISEFEKRAEQYAKTYHKERAKEVETILDEGMFNGLPTHIIAEQVMESLNK
jgi:hypothetical protein